MAATVTPGSGPSSPGNPPALASPSLATYRAPEDLHVDDEYFGGNAIAGPSNLNAVVSDKGKEVAVEADEEQEEEAFDHYFRADEDAGGSTEAEVGALSDDVVASPLGGSSSDTEDDDDDEYEEEHEIVDRGAGMHIHPHPGNLVEEIAREVLEGLEVEHEEDEEDDDEDGNEGGDEVWGVQIQDAPANGGNMGAGGAEAPANRGDAQENGPGGAADILAGDLDEIEGAVEDDMDGAMEAIGLRGPVYGVFQNSALMIFLLDTAIGVGICLPFTIGKTAALLSLEPRRVLHLLHLPIRAIRVMTDPVVDGSMFLVSHYIVPHCIRLAKSFVQVVTAMSLGIVRIILGKDTANRAKEACLSTVDLVFNTSNWPLDFLSGKNVNETIATPSTNPGWIDQVVMPAIEPYFAPIGKEVRVSSGDVLEGWIRFATNDGPAERIFSVALGYMVVAFFLAVYLNVLTVGNMKTAGRAVRTAVRQQLLVLKVATFIFIELVIFPLGCGMVLDFCTIWLFPEANLASRVTFFYQAPLTAMFYHWIAGTMFMYSFAVLLSGARSVMRPGAMWFIKDPQDHNTHPIRDILDRPTWVQLRKIFISGIMYSFVVLLTVGSIAGLLLIGSRSIMPFRWKNREPLSNVPIDLLFLHFVLPYTMLYFRPRRGMKKFATAIWKYLAARLRLTSYFFGGRHGGEEFTPRTWSLNIFRERTNRDAVLADYDGTFRRVPATDQLVLPRDMRSTVAVTATGQPIDDEAKLLMAQQDGETLRAKRIISDDFMIVYIPPHFRWRIIAFICILWIVGAVCVGLSVAIPIQLGRSFFRLFTPKEVHDGYSVLAGFYLLWGCYVVGKSIDKLDKRRQRRGEEGPRGSLWVLVVKRGLLWLAKAAFMVFVLGVVVPVLIAVVVDLYMIIPLRLLLDPEWMPRIRVVDSWAVGLLYMRIVLRMARLQPDHPLARGLHQIKHNGWTHPDPVAATKDVLIPLLTGLFGMILMPGIVFQAVLYFLPAFKLDNRFMFTHIYPGIFVVAAAGRSSLLLGETLASWSQTVRDKEFLVEMRLKNLEPEIPKPTSETHVDESGVELSD